MIPHDLVKRQVLVTLVVAIGSAFCVYYFNRPFHQYFALPELADALGTAFLVITAFLAHVVSRTGSYLSATAGCRLGDPMAYLVAPPLEATFGIDAALKSADVQLVTYVPPPSETNYSAAFLTGSQAACKAACNAFADAVLDIARNPIQRA